MSQAVPDETPHGDSGGTLAAEVAGWTPPWQRDNRPDTPPDEPVEHAEPGSSVVSQPDDPQPAAAETDEPPRSAEAEPARPAEAGSARPAAPSDAPPLPLSADLAGTLEAI
ncbi:MAG TPA: hypothetical protein VE172_07250, partial [Stackebrandtia sp.]|nr:hypothetical protein [Stackebrandtia sp.]